MNSECWLAKSRVDITLCQHGKFPATLLLKFFVLYYKRNVKHFIRVDIQLYQHEWKLEKREIVWKHDARKGRVFSYNFEFFQFPRVLYFIFLKCNIDVKGAKYQSNSNSLDYILQVAEHWSSISKVIHVGSIPWQTWYEYTLRVTTTASKFCIIFPCCYKHTKYLFTIKVWKRNCQSLRTEFSSTHITCFPSNNFLSVYFSSWIASSILAMFSFKASHCSTWSDIP